jgi:hypothetical protein
MAEHDAPSQGSAESITSEIAGTSHTIDATLNSRISACEKLVDDAIEKDLSALALAKFLKELGLEAGEAVDYIDGFNQHVAIRYSKACQPDSPTSNPSGPSDPVQAQEDQDKAVEEAAWASLCSCLHSSAPTQSSDVS